MTTQSKLSTQGLRVVGASALLLFLNACQTPAAQKAAQEAAVQDRNAEISRILDLKARGVITDEQAVQIMAALVNEGKTTAVPATAAVKASAGSVEKPSAPVAAASKPAAPAPASVPSPAPVAAVASVAAKDARYAPKTVVAGRLRSIGSDTMDNLVASWEEVFIKYHPALRILHEGRGSSTGTPALVEERADFAPMSRVMLEAETAKFRERFGYEATQIRVAIDALGVYVHPQNPLAKSGLTLAQVDAIFSATRKRGGAERLSTWGQLGLGGEWANAPINVYGRNKASGTYGYFRDSALGKGEFGAWVVEQDGSSQVVAKVEADKFGIGYSGVGYRTPGVAMAPLAKEAGQAFVAPGEEAALDGRYPLARPLLLALNRNPAAPLSDLQREFLNFVLGPVGQEVVKKEGYYPLPQKIVAEEMVKLR